MALHLHDRFPLVPETVSSTRSRAYRVNMVLCPVYALLWQTCIARKPCLFCPFQQNCLEVGVTSLPLRMVRSSVQGPIPPHSKCPVGFFWGTPLFRSALISDESVGSAQWLDTSVNFSYCWDAASNKLSMLFCNTASYCWDAASRSTFRFSVSYSATRHELPTIEISHNRLYLPHTALLSYEIWYTCCM